MPFLWDLFVSGLNTSRIIIWTYFEIRNEARSLNKFFESKQKNQKLEGEMN